MRNRIKPLALFATLATMTAFGSQLALAETARQPDDQQQTQSGPGYGKQKKHPRRDRQMFFQRIAKKLGLSEQQKAQATELFKAHRAEVKPVAQTMMSERRKLRELIETGSADESAIRAQSAKVASAEADLAVARGEFSKKIHAILTPEQTAKLKVLLKEREKSWDKARRDHWGPMETGE